jgi:hypothetical protein
MTQDEIIEMAYEAGIIQPQNVIKTLETFAKLIAQHEREACAKEAEKTFYSVQAVENIRARGQA